MTSACCSEIGWASTDLLTHLLGKSRGQCQITHFVCSLVNRYFIQWDNIFCLRLQNVFGLLEYVLSKARGIKPIHHIKNPTCKKIPQLLYVHGGLSQDFLQILYFLTKSNCMKLPKRVVDMTVKLMKIEETAVWENKKDKLTQNVQDHIHLWQKRVLCAHWCVSEPRQRHRGQKFNTAVNVPNYCTCLDMLYITSRKTQM